MSEIRVNDLDPLLNVPNEAAIYVVSENLDYKTTKQALLQGLLATGNFQGTAEDLATQSFKKNQIYSTTLVDLQVNNFAALTTLLIKNWIISLAINETDDLLYHFKITSANSFRIYILEGKIKGQAVQESMIKLYVAEKTTNQTLQETTTAGNISTNPLVVKSSLNAPIETVMDKDSFSVKNAETNNSHQVYNDKIVDKITANGFTSTILTEGIEPTETNNYKQFRQNKDGTHAHLDDIPAPITIDSTVNQNSPNPVTSGGVFARIADLILSFTESLSYKVDKVTGARLINADEITKLVNQSGTNSGDETTATIQTKRLLKTFNGQSLEGPGNANIGTPTAGNLLRANGLIFESIPEVEFMRNKEAFAKSFLGGIHNLDFLRVFDSFNRPDSSNLGTTDSGTPIVKLRGTSGNIINNTCRITTSGDINAVAVNITNTQRCRIKVVSNVITGSTNLFNPGYNSFIYILKDVNNGLIFRIVNQFTYIEKIVNGVVTNLLNGNYITGSNNRAMQGNSLTLEADLIAGNLGAIASSVFLRQDVNPAVVGQAIASSLFDPNTDNVFANPTDINFIGWAGSNNLAIFIDE